MTEHAVDGEVGFPRVGRPQNGFDDGLLVERHASASPLTSGIATVGCPALNLEITLAVRGMGWLSRKDITADYSEA